MKKISTGWLSRAWEGLRNFWKDESGAIMLETVLVFPIQLMLTLMIIQAAFVWSAANIINYAAFQAARTAMLEIRGPEITSFARKQAWLAANVITSVLANPVKNEAQRSNALRLRTLHHNYYFPGGHPLGDTEGLQVTIGYDPNLSSGIDDLVVGAHVRYLFPLTVPLAGNLIGYNYYKGSVLKPGVRFIPMQQVVRVPKPWPY